LKGKMTKRISKQYEDKNFVAWKAAKRIIACFGMEVNEEGKQRLMKLILLAMDNRFEY